MGAMSMAETMEEAARSIWSWGLRWRGLFSERGCGWEVGSWMLRSGRPKGRQGKMVVRMSILVDAEKALGNGKVAGQLGLRREVEGCRERSQLLVLMPRMRSM